MGCALAQVASPACAPLLRALLVPLLDCAARASYSPSSPSDPSCPAAVPGGVLLALQLAEALLRLAPGGASAVAAAGGADALHALEAGCAWLCGIHPALCLCTLSLFSLPYQLPLGPRGTAAGRGDMLQTLPLPIQVKELLLRLVPHGALCVSVCAF